MGDSKENSSYILTVPGRGFCFIAPVEQLLEPEEGPVDETSKAGEPHIAGPDTATWHPRFISTSRAYIALFVMLFLATSVWFAKQRLSPLESSGASDDAGIALNETFKSRIPGVQTGSQLGRVNTEDGKNSFNFPSSTYMAQEYNKAAIEAHYTFEPLRAWELSKKALELDPDSTEALASYGKMNGVVASMPPAGLTVEEINREMLKVAEKLIELEPRDYRGHRLKLYSLLLSKDWNQIQPVLNTLRGNNPNPYNDNNLAFFYLTIGNFKAALDIYASRTSKSMLDMSSQGFYMLALELNGNREEARRVYKQGGELKSLWWGNTVNVFLALGRGEHIENISSVQISDDVKRILRALNQGDIETVSTLLVNYMDADHMSSAETVYYSAVAAYIGEDDMAIQLLNEAVQEMTVHLYWAWLPVFDEVRRTLAFADIIEEAGLVEYWNIHGWPEICYKAADRIMCDRWQALP